MSVLQSRWAEQPGAMLEQVQRMLDRASRPGYAHLYGQAEKQLSVPVHNDSERMLVWLLWAEVEQHQHNFDSALSALGRVFESDSTHVEARLMAARIRLIQGEYEQARQHCLALIGNTDLLTASICALEVASYRGSLKSSYQQLTALVARQGVPEDARGAWVVQMLADMALRLEQAEEAAHWLDQRFSNANVSYLLQWADAQLALAQFEVVMRRLEPIVDAAPAVDDSLALRLALAEKALEGRKWQDYIASRMTLRVQREDTEHAADLARYYLHLEPNPEKALHWAEVNWESAREHADRQLLLQARNGVKKPSPDGESE
ncbi:tetratricopeptide repeat protein [Marinimicrobium agarilyticum]|uniref:tetratricopeptide repeat protein n=1 Tax=Marinimicrobium agarilyticum TaxID=306546 RepID=UPI0012F69EA4|nr:tetratricopeptide repeat protein [Marinimicrobium agarilyticum]